MEKVFFPFRKTVIGGTLESSRWVGKQLSEIKLHNIKKKHSVLS